MDTVISTVDKIDYEIISILGKDPRASLSFIAKTLNIDLRTVKKRIENLQDKGILEFSISIDAVALGYQSIVDIIIEVEPEYHDDFIEKCMQEASVFFLAKGWGNNTFVAQINCRNNAKLNELVYDVFAKMPGVRIKNVEMIVSTLKDGTKWIPDRDEFLGDY